MLIQELDARSAREWDDYISQHPDSTCYHNRAWQIAAQRAYGLYPRYLIARSRPHGPIEGVITLFQIRGVVRAHLANGLFGAYAPILSQSDEIRSALLERARGIALREGLPHLVMKTVGEWDAAAFEGFHRLNSWVIATLRLKRDPEEMWKGFRDKIRNCVRKAVKSGLEVRAGRDQLKHFYDVLAENMHKKGAPIYGFQFMQELVEAFGEQAELVTLWKDRQVVSGALILKHRKTATVPFASSRPSALAMSPNNLLYWEVIRRSCVSGCELLDFGRSLKNSGPLSFKLGWGAEIFSQPCYVYSLCGDQLALTPNHRGVDWFVNQWKRLPRPVADALGPVVCRQVAGLL